MFYPGNYDGQELVYSENKRRQLLSRQTCGLRRDYVN